MKITKRRQTDEEADRLAEEFVKRLGAELAEWLKLDEMQKIDERIQEFAARIAHGESFWGCLIFCSYFLSYGVLRNYVNIFAFNDCSHSRKN